MASLIKNSPSLLVFTNAVLPCNEIFAFAIGLPDWSTTRPFTECSAEALGEAIASVKEAATAAATNDDLNIVITLRIKPICVTIHNSKNDTVYHNYKNQDVNYKNSLVITLTEFSRLMGKNAS